MGWATRPYASTCGTSGIDEGGELEPYLTAARKSKHPRPSPTTPDALVARVAYYKREFMHHKGNLVVDGLTAVYEHDCAHMGRGSPA